MENNSKKILVVDDDADIREFITYNLSKYGYTIEEAENGKEAISKAKKTVPDLILLDIMMPGMDGIDVCQLLREDSNLQNVLIVFLTARAEDYSQIAGFDAGADDYINKPIKPKLIVKKIEALLRRNQRLSEFVNFEKQSKTSKYEFRNLSIDTEMHLVLKDNQEITLPKKEFKLLKLLISKPGKVFTRDEIYYAIWGNKVVVGDRTIDVHVRKLREKIGDDFIKTIKGIGYRFEQ
ncbi:MAG TPA: response regulator transcription factor [Bacteroidales bacterium]|nr:response regulator transcription factor [Bacteroidales bacterium]